MRALAGLLGCVVVGLAAPASAQRCAATGSAEEAAAAFERAGRAAQEERWEAARAAFEQAYALSCAPSALFNQAVALRELRRYAEALTVLERFFVDHGDVDAELLAAAGEERRASESRVARIDVDASPGELRLDGQPVDRGAGGPAPLVVNPGPHTLRLRAEGGTDSWQGTLSEGQRQAVQLRVQAVRERAEPVVSTDSGGASAVGPVLFAIGAAAGVAAGVVGGVALARNDELRAMCDGLSCPPNSEGLADEVRDLSLVADVLWPSATALAVVGLVWWIVEAASAEGEAEATCGPRSCGARVRF